MSQQIFLRCLGGGRAWIAGQAPARFGTPSPLLVDLFHLSEYLSAAAPRCIADQPLDAWFEQQKKHPKRINSEAVPDPHGTLPETAQGHRRQARADFKPVIGTSTILPASSITRASSLLVYSLARGI